MGLFLLATTDTQIIRVVEALYTQTPGYTYLTNFRTYVTENSVDDLANALAGNFSTQSDAVFAATITANLGLTGDALTAGNAYLEGQFAAYPTARGKVVLDAMNALSTLESHEVYGTAALAYNANVVASLTYSTVVANTAILAAGVGQTFSLTTSTDGSAITGTTKDDIYNSVIALAGTTDTLTSGDVIAGGSGTDTLNVTASGTTTGAESVTGVTTTGVENLVITNLDTTAANSLTFDAATMTGVTSIAANNSSAGGDVIFTNLKAAVTASMSANAGDLTLGYLAAITAGTTDTQALTVSGTNGTFTVTGFETLAVTTTGIAATLADIASTGVTKLTVAGDQNLTITAAIGSTNSTLVTVDASALTGNLTIKSGVAAQTITGGAGDDSIDMQGVVTATDVLDGGAGTDTLKQSIGNATITSTELAKTSNFEVFDIDATHDSAVLNLASVTGITTLNAAASNKLTVTGTFTTDGDDYTYTLNGTTTAIASAAGTGTAAEIAAEIATSIDGLDAFAASVSGAEVTVTAVTGEYVDFTAITNTTQATDVVGFTTTPYDVAFSNLAGTEAINVYSAGTLTTSLADASGTSDAMTINLATTTTDQALSKTVDAIVVANIETLNLDSSGLSATTKINTLSALTGDATLTTLNITGDSSLIITDHASANTKLATINASTFTGDLTLSDAVATLTQTITTGTGNDTLAMGANLTQVDVIDAGANTVLASGTAGEDLLTATVTGLTATTGVLQVANVERINLTNAGTAVINAASITGASEIAVLTNTTQTTISNLAAGVAIGVGHKGTDGDADGILVLSLADATGTADALTINFNDTAGGNTNTVNLKGTAIENYTFNFHATDTAIADAALTVSALNASTITITGSTLDATHTIGLGTLDTDTTSVDATGYKGVLTATAGLAIATTFTADSINAHVLTGSTKDDTFNLGELSTAVIDISGSTHVSGDTLNATLTSTASDFTSVDGVEILNLTVKASTAAGFDDATKDDGLNLATTINILGGNSLSTFTLATGSIGGGTVTAFDASGFAGKLSNVTFAASALTGTVTVTGSANAADTVSATYVGSSAAHTVKMTAVETFGIALSNHATEVVLDMAAVTGLTTVNITDASSELLELKNLITGVTVDVTSTDATATEVEVKLASVTGSADSQTFIVAAASADDNVKLITADIETLSISSDTANQVDLDLSSVSMTASAGVVAVNFTGSNDIELMATAAQITTIDASGMATGGALVQTARSATVASTYTGSIGDDTLIMVNASDVIDAGTGTDTLVITKSMVLGGVLVDLSSTTDQITSYNGSSNSAIQKGFINADVSGVTGSFGAQITANLAGSIITGTANADAITGGIGVDTIIGTVGADTIAAGAADIVRYNAAADGLDNITGWTATSVIQLGIDGDNEDVFNSTGAVVFNGGTTSTVVGTVQDLHASDYNEGNTAADFWLVDEINVWTTSTGAATLGHAMAAIDAGGSTVTDAEDAFLIFYNSTSTNVELWEVVAADKAGGTDNSGGLLIASFTDIAATGIAAAFSATSFDLITIA